MLERMPFGSTGLMVAPISLGTVKIGRNTNVKYPAGFDLPSDSEVTSLLSTAASLGINLIDTAPAYGSSERRLGKLLPGSRDEWTICTKAGEFYDNEKSFFDFSRTAIERSIVNSLAQLKTDYLDVVLLHSDGRDLEILEQTDAMETLTHWKQKGAIRSIGMSTKTVEGSLAALPFCDVLMVTLNISDQSQLGVICEAHAMGKAIMLKKVFASGYADPQESLRFALTTPGVSTAVIGTVNPDHLMVNVRTAEEITGP
jgi:aryl-alcohol dehydrogenase-like predicted oxidoreductase